MNQPGGAALDAEAQAHAVLRRQKQMVQSIREELDNSYAKLRQTLRMRDELYYRLFPPVRADRDPEGLMARVVQLRAEAKRTQEAITKQEAELQILDAKLFLVPEHVVIGEASQPTSFNKQEKEWMEDLSLQERIVQGRQNLANLKIGLAETRIKLDKTESLLSPIRLLPIEVLGEIFSYCKGSKLSVSSPSPPPLAITHTCSSWRSIAINQPGLWTNIRISINDNHNRNGWLSLVQLWLERSQDLPLSFSISENEKHDYRLSSNSIFFRMLDLFTPHSQRWKNARLSNPAFAVPDLKWFSKLSGEASFPLLESISVRCLTLENADIDKVMDMLVKSPRVHTIAWKIKSPSATPTFPWAQLTTLDLLLIISFEELLGILSQAQRLTYADLNFYISSSAMQRSPITYPNLQTLHLGYAGKIQVFFDSLTLPNLTDLAIDSLPAIFVLDAVHGPWLQESFMSFLQRSKCELESLSLLDLSPSPADVLAILQHLSASLVRLALETNQSTCITDEVLLALTYPWSAPPSNPPRPTDSDLVGADELHNEEEFASVLCPSLEHIKLWGGMETTDGVLADMVLSRWSPFVESPRLAKLHSGEFGVPEQSKLPQDEARLANLHPHNISYVTFEPDE